MFCDTRANNVEFSRTCMSRIGSRRRRAREIISLSCVVSGFLTWTIEIETRREFSDGNTNDIIHVDEFNMIQQNKEKKEDILLFISSYYN